jgi:hypothetical protein
VAVADEDLISRGFRHGVFLVLAQHPLARSGSVPNPLHILEQNLLAASVIKFRGSAVGVTGNALSGFQGAVIFQKIRDAGGPE